jgi:hypothetical protein
MVDLNNVVKLLGIISLFFLLALSCSHTGKTLEMTIIVDPHVTPLYEPPTEYEI